MRRFTMMTGLVVACVLAAGCYGSGSSVSVGVVGGYGYPYYGSYGGYGGWGGYPYGGGVVITGRPYVPRTHPLEQEVEEAVEQADEEQQAAER